MATELLAFKNVSFSYNGEHDFLFRGCSFLLSPGDRMVLKGESGTGKTTLIRLLLGFEQPDEGDVLYKGESLQPETYNNLRSETAWLPQDLDLGSGKVEEVFYFPFEFEHNRAERPTEGAVLDVFQTLGLPKGMWNTDFSDLSTGQRQRVGVALCYLLNKQILLLDEPTSALDERSKQQVADLLFKDQSKTILSTSHDPWWIKQFDRVISLKNSQ